MKATLPWLLIMAVIASCQTSPTTTPTTTPAVKDTALKATDSGYADVNGLKMYYEVYGSGKPLVLLHGSFMNINTNWASIIPQFAEGRQVIVAEMQAHGRTKDIPRAFRYENMADDVSGLLTHLKIDSADVLGYSMGGGIAYQFAIRHPQQLRRLVILSSTYAHDGWWPEVEASFATFTPDMFKGTPIEDQFKLYNNNDTTHFGDFIKKVMSADIGTYDWTAAAKQIKAPIFQLIGDADGVRYEHAIELFKAKGGGKMGDMGGLPESRLAILPGTTHIGMMVNTKVWMPMVIDFLDGDLKAPPPSF
ncbi:alpha/beta fold hydrolase [Paraflavitalea pollutisoli]|uniref:alpha/beta fold hydrolase n=1 Tax=Paraflavitalea pollutisoli TaxID=3034143 RepID=UPI0023ECB9A8|nr:alpha/beta hydrolase [Paraflavitalea sp. H1-2-19X]